MHFIQAPGVSSGLDVAGIADVAVAAVLGIVGIYFTYFYRRQQKIGIEENRLKAYEALWSTMEPASPYRLSAWRYKPLSEKEREALFSAFTNWYYENGNGMFLGDSTRHVYLKAKDNLVCDLNAYTPASIGNELELLAPDVRECVRGDLAIRQLSLLRNRMKADLGVFGIPYHVDLNDMDREFLCSCGVDLTAKPWSDDKKPPYQIGPAVKKLAEESSNRNSDKV